MISDNSEIKINKIVLVGIRNPQVLILGTHRNLYEKLEFGAFIDGKSAAVRCRRGETAKSFILTLIVPKKAKNIKIHLKKKGRNRIVVEVQNRWIIRVLNKIHDSIRQVGRNCCSLVPLSEWKRLIRSLRGRAVAAKQGVLNPFVKREYLKWTRDNEQIDRLKHEFAYQPLISIVIPVYNIGKEYLSECIDSILNQTYSNFEICLADDCSTNQETIETLRKYDALDVRIKVIYRKENGHISRATNSAISIASGEFIALMDNDDVLAVHALSENIKVLNANPELDFIYSDEDKLDVDRQRRDPHFKSDYAPDSLLGSNYICHFAVLRKSIVDQIEGYRVGVEGAQDYDLFLRFLEQTTPDRVHHIPQILYHWRMIPGSTSMSIDNKSYAVDRGAKVVADALERRGIDGTVEVHPDIPYYRVKYGYETELSISIIIPTRDYAEVLETCLESIYKYTAYQNFEVVVVDNNSEKRETFDLFQRYEEQYPNFRVVDAKIEFNYSEINNLAIHTVTSDFVCLLNNDTEVISADWLEIMVGYAKQPHIGAVGAKLLYPDQTVQHAGVICGLGGIANHMGIGARKQDPGMYGRLAIPFNYSAVTAACLLVDTKKYREVGGLNEELKVAFNDVDFCLKLLQQGYYNVCVPQVNLYHHESKSRGSDIKGEKCKRFIREQEYMYDTWGRVLMADRYYNVNLSLKHSFYLDKELI